MHDGIWESNSLVLNPFDAPSEASWDTHMKRLLVATETKQHRVCILSKQLTQRQKKSDVIKRLSEWKNYANIWTFWAVKVKRPPLVHCLGRMQSVWIQDLCTIAQCGSLDYMLFHWHVNIYSALGSTHLDCVAACLYLNSSVKYLHSEFLRARPTVWIVAVSVSLLRASWLIAVQ